MSGAISRRALLAGLLPLAGCSFQPVYMPTATRSAGPAERELAKVNVPLMADRPGQVLRQALQARLHNDSGGLHRYDLRVAFWVNGEGLAVTPDNSATRLRLTGYANWVLLANGPPQVKLTEGSARALDGLNILDQQYFALDMENEAVQRRIADRIADQITMQLAIYFRQQATKTAAG